MYKASSDIQKFIKNEEGLRLLSYKDLAGVWTAGWGHCLGTKPPPTLPITLETAQAWFDMDIHIAEQGVGKYIKVSVTQGVYDACISFVFNLGESAFAHSSILQYINQRKFIEAASWLPRYCHINNNVALKGLLTRRLKEANIFLGEGYGN